MTASLREGQARELTVIEDAHLFVLNSDGSILATTSADGAISLWDYATFSRTDSPQPISTFSGAGTSLQDLDFTPDGRYLVSVEESGVTRIYPLRMADLIAAAQSRVTRPFSPEECKQYRIESC